MAYVYVSDSGPEAEEYVSNYFYFDETSPRTVAFIEELLLKQTTRDSGFRTRLRAICREDASPESPGV